MAFDYEFRRNVDLLALLVRKDVTLHYKRTALGILWSLLNPLLLAVLYYTAFTVFIRQTAPNFILFLLSVLFPWTWFSNSISLSNNILIENKSLIKKVPFPRHFLLISTIVSQCILFLCSVPIVAVLTYHYGSRIGLIWVLGIPVLIVIQFIMTMGLCLIVSSINVYFRDFYFIVAFLMNVLFWLTPILYPIEKIPEQYHSWFLVLNPLTVIMSSWRGMFMSNTLRWDWVGLSFLVSLVVLSLGTVVFQRLGRRIDEVL
ncbi:MAG: ABC transporter permease [Nitrospirae bacterium]|nr:ABC transporter permease [Nitrospirota bacterium]